jgi:hypothetical protein
MSRELSVVSAAGGGPGDVGSTASMPRRANNANDPKHRTGPSSLFILSETNVVRRMTKFLIEWPPFEYTVLVCRLSVNFTNIYKQIFRTKVISAAFFVPKALANTFWHKKIGKKAALKMLVKLTPFLRLKQGF